MNDKDYIISACAICLVCVFTPKQVALCFIVITITCAAYMYCKNNITKP